MTAQITVADILQRSPETKRVSDAITGVLNDTPQGREFTEALRAEAIRHGLTPAEWEDLKAATWGMMFCQVLVEHEDIREMVAGEYAEMLLEQFRKNGTI